MKYFVKIGTRTLGPFNGKEIIEFAKEKKIRPKTPIATKAEGPFQPLASVWDHITSPTHRAKNRQQPNPPSTPPLPDATKLDRLTTVAVDETPVAELPSIEPVKVTPETEQTNTPLNASRDQKQKLLLIACGVVASTLLLGLLLVGVRFAGRMASQPSEPATTSEPDTSPARDDAELQLALGLMHARGDGLPQDFTKAVRCFQIAAEQNLAGAQYHLGFMYANGYGVQEDKAEAIRWYQLAAKQNNPRAQVRLGLMYENGEGVVADNVEAVRWYRRAAEQEDPAAQYFLGLCYVDGTGVTEDKAEAANWFRRSAEQGDADAQYQIGLMHANGDGVTEDKAEAIRWLKLAAEQDNPRAQVRLGLMHENGEGAVADNTEAARWYRRAAERGDATAQYYLGLSYVDGAGVKEDKTEAAKWLRLSAEQGDADAQIELGLMHENGEGVVANSAEAVKWYRRAAEQGDATAQYFLGLNYIEGKGVPEDADQAAKWLRLAAEQGDADAQYHVGLMYANGYGLTKDKTQAVRWLELSVSNKPSLQNPAWTFLADAKATAGDESLKKAISYYDEGQRLANLGDYQNAIQAYDLAIAAAPEFPWGYNNRAYLMVSCPDPKFQNHTQALELAKKSAELSRYQNWRILDTLAAANAGVGNFEKATELAAIVVARAPLSAVKECEFYLNRYRSRLRWAPYTSQAIDSSEDRP
jgi:TPR repeat protein